ncbi:MAG: MFS transporter [Dongia sp.]|jgi:MFS family permease
MTIGITAIAVLKNRDFRLYALFSLLAQLSAEVLIVAIGWSIYDITNNPFDLALVALVQFVPNCLLVLVTGVAADRYPRKRILVLCTVAEFVFTLGIFLVARSSLHDVWPMLLLIAGLAAGRAFGNPAALALAPTLVEREQIPAAVSTATSAWQFSSIAGPALGGVLYNISANVAYTSALVMVLVSLVSIAAIRKVEEPHARESATVDMMTGGFRFMLREKVVLGASSLDLFAVLLGSTAALLPIFARDILVAGPFGLGLLRAGIGIGALAMAIYLGLFPIRRHAGKIMFATVAVFGLGTIVFGLSHWIWLSVGALILMGASDMISVYIREVLVQLWTPDSLRGRVNAVYMLMISASNELGGFRAGGAAKLFAVMYAVSFAAHRAPGGGHAPINANAFGAITATVIGGICTVAVAVLWARWFPALRKADDLTATEQLEADSRRAAERAVVPTP